MVRPIQVHGPLGVAEIFAAFSVRQAGRRAEHLLG